MSANANGRHPKNGRLLNEILEGKLLKIASDCPTAHFMQLSEKGWRQTDTNNLGQRLKLVEFNNTIRRKRANRTRQEIECHAQPFNSQ